MLNKIWELREKVLSQKPLVLNITNNVVTNFTANILLAAGASPIMSEGVEEAEDLIRISNVVVLNIGTLHERQNKYFLKAGRLANQYGKLVVLDPVGVGASNLRNSMAEEILNSCKVNVIRGNYGEINFLLGSQGETKGVDSISGSFNLERAQSYAFDKKLILAATGESDFIVGENIYQNNTGDIMLQAVTGTGCALSSLVGAFIACTDEIELAVLAACAYYGAAAKKAAHFSKGPGTFSAQFIDALYNLTFDEFKEIATNKTKIIHGNAQEK